MGESTTAGGMHSVAMGYNSTAGGSSSFAAGTGATASGNHSVAIGNNVSTNSQDGSFVLGCQSLSALMNSSAPNQMSMRFAGGYRLFSDIQQSKGVYMNGGVSGWTNYSDRNTKENISEIDGEALLAKIRHLSVTEWNYIGADPGIRYIGPMAQDFWQAFKLGGTDSLGINSISIDGVNLAAIKALEARTAELRESARILAELRATVERQQEKLSESTVRIAELESQLSDFVALREEMQTIKALLLQNGVRPDALRVSHDGIHSD
jgi:autotransporter adhesin